MDVWLHSALKISSQHTEEESSKPKGILHQKKKRHFHIATLIAQQHWRPMRNKPASSQFLLTLRRETVGFTSLLSWMRGGSVPALHPPHTHTPVHVLDLIQTVIWLIHWLHVRRTQKLTRFCCLSEEMVPDTYVSVLYPCSQCAAWTHTLPHVGYGFLGCQWPHGLWGAHAHTHTHYFIHKVAADTWGTRSPALGLCALRLSNRYRQVRGKRDYRASSGSSSQEWSSHESNKSERDKRKRNRL